MPSRADVIKLNLTKDLSPEAGASGTDKAPLAQPDASAQVTPSLAATPISQDPLDAIDTPVATSTVPEVPGENKMNKLNQIASMYKGSLA